MAEEQAAGGGDAAAAPKKKLDLQVILLLVNFLAVAGAAGTIAYTKFIYKKPKITEAGELDLIKQKAGGSEKEESAERVTNELEELRINIASADGKNHYVAFSMAVECADKEACERFEARKPLMMDKIIAVFNRKTHQELRTIQGRLILKEQLLREFNNLAGPGTITDIMYSNFVLE